ncbi:MAG: hypothetical protein CV088_06210 [Nitrospira sp. LK70]|nr:hypothetical protein [Nitrospira sp. LK70]
MTMDEILTVGQPNSTWSQVFLAIGHLSRQNLIALHRMGLSYHMSLMNHEWPLDQEHHPARCDGVSGLM